VLLLVGTCLQLCEAGSVEEGTLLRQTLAGLKQRVRTRPARGLLSLLAAPDDAEPQQPRGRHQTDARRRVPAPLLADAAAAPPVFAGGRWGDRERHSGGSAVLMAASRGSARGGRGCRDGPARLRGGGATRPGPRPARPGRAWALRRRGPGGVAGAPSPSPCSDRPYPRVGVLRTCPSTGGGPPPAGPGPEAPPP